MPVSPSRNTSQGVIGANLICFFGMMVWSMGLPAADMVIGPMTPLPLAAARTLLASAVLLPLWIAVDGWTTVRHADWGRGLLVGGVGLGLGAWLMLFGQARTDAVTIAVTGAMMPVVSIALESMAGTRRLTLPLVIGVALSLAGGLLAVGAGTSGVRLISTGALAAFAAVFVYSWGSFATVRSFPGLSIIGQTTITLVGAAVVTLAMALIQAALGGSVPDWQAMGRPQVAALLFNGIIALGLSQLLWIASIGRLGVGIGAMHLNATPFYVMGLAYMLGGGWNGWQALSAAIVALGVLIAQIGPMRGSEPKQAN